MEKTEITIIGAGAIGLAIAHFLSENRLDVTVIEKNPSFGRETSSRNSEVIHAGLYYPKNSFKAKTCVEGRGLLYDFCYENGIPHKKLGKLIVASGKEKIAKLETIRKNALDCGAGNLEFLSRPEMRKLEPDIKAECALLSPESGIFDTHAFMGVLHTSAKERGVNFAFSVEAEKIEKKKSFYEITVKEPKGGRFSFQTGLVINASGLWADRVAEFVGIDPDKASYRIHYCKGGYFRIRNPKKFSIKHLIYPPPAETDLGVHLTPDMSGGLRLGPDAKYVKDMDYTVREEEKDAFLNSVREFLPDLERNDIIPDTAGIRPKLQGRGEGFRDFVIRDEADKGFPGFINLIGIESPGLTSSLAIGEMVKELCLRIL